MNKTLLYSFFLCINLLLVNAQTTCNTEGNIVVFSNYDGGILNINVDQNIPNLKIGICSYEAVDIRITGTYASNVTAVIYAGFNNSSNTCSQNINSTTISGVPANIFTNVFLPPVDYNNPNGYVYLICNYSCNASSSQSGCNTPDQVVSYFVNVLGGVYRSHLTQYGCWTNTHNISSGGNCCIVPPSLGVDTAQNQIKTIFFSPNPANDKLNVRFSDNTTMHNIEIYNMLGEKVLSVNFLASDKEGEIDLKNLTAGVYFVKLTEGEFSAVEKIIVN